MKTKKVGALLLSASMAASMITGCGNSGGNSSGSNSGSGGTDENGVVELTFYNADGQEDPWTDPVAEVLTEKTV